MDNQRVVGDKHGVQVVTRGIVEPAIVNLHVVERVKGKPQPKIVRKVMPFHHTPGHVWLRWLIILLLLLLLNVLSTHVKPHDCAPPSRGITQRMQ